MIDESLYIAQSGWNVARTVNLKPVIHHVKV